jgi:hypothetical protein
MRQLNPILYLGRGGGKDALQHNNGMQRTRIQQLFYPSSNRRAADAWR